MIFGYCQKNHINEISDAICRIIRLFYDEYFYWRIQGDEFKEFLNAENGDVMYYSSTILQVKELNLNIHYVQMDGH